MTPSSFKKHLQKASACKSNNDVDCLLSTRPCLGIVLPCTRTPIAAHIMSTYARRETHGSIAQPQPSRRGPHTHVTQRTTHAPRAAHTHTHTHTPHQLLLSGPVRGVARRQEPHTIPQVQVHHRSHSRPCKHRIRRCGMHPRGSTPERGASRVRSKLPLSGNCAMNLGAHHA